MGVIPDAEQCLSFALPAFKVAGTTVAGFAAFKNHLGYLPHGGWVFPDLAEELAGYDKSKGALHSAIDEPLARELVEKLILMRLQREGSRRSDSRRASRRRVYSPLAKLAAPPR